MNKSQYQSKSVVRSNEQQDAAKLLAQLPFMRIPKTLPKGKVRRHAQEM